MSFDRCAFYPIVFCHSDVGNVSKASSSCSPGVLHQIDVLDLQSNYRVHSANKKNISKITKDKRWCLMFTKPIAKTRFSWLSCASIFDLASSTVRVTSVEAQTLPKAQRTRGLSSAYQNNFFRSYHKFLHKS